MDWGNDECGEYNRKLSKEIYDRKIEEYNELKKWLGAYDTNFKDK
tara:strand:+ start:280 stop:414 length:135 start_codon:yes stop_codon:yes gene_type:complete